MAQKEKIDAFVLRTINYAERDVIVTLLSSKYGRVSALAKNARTSKRFPGGLHPFRKIEALIERKPQRGTSVFVEMRVLRDFPSIESNYDAIVIGSYATELMREVSREDVESPELLALLESFYAELDELGTDVRTLETILHHYELRLLELVGTQPSLWECHRCGLPHEEFDKLQCSRSGEGLLCSSCRRPGEAVGMIERDTLSTLQYYHRPEVGAPDALLMPDIRQQARRVLDNSFKLLLLKDLKSRPMLDTVLT